MPNQEDKYPGDAIVDAFDSLKPTGVHWLWENRIPRGKLTLLAGDPGIGKSMLTCDIAARLSRGDPWPDGRAGTQGGTIFMSAENDAADTILPRVIAAGADLRQISSLRAVATQSQERAVSLADIRAIADALAQRGRTALIVIDPVAAFTPSHDANSNNGVRSLLTPLAALAAQWNIAVILVTHMAKRGGKAVHRSMGSLAYIATARAAWLLTQDNRHRGRRVLLPVKNNLCPASTAMAFRIRENRIQWEQDAFAIDTDIFMEAQNSPEIREHEAAMWLISQLADGQWHSAAELFRNGSVRAFTRRTMERASKDIEVERKRLGQHDYYWRLPPFVSGITEIKEPEPAALPA